MNNYTIYCTEEQTRKALALGAPIECRSDNYDPSNRYFRFELHTGKYGGTGYYYVKYPTAEQLIGWLETQGIREVSLHHLKDVWHICIYLDNGDITHNEVFYLSRKEATIAAIDAALEYLQNKK